MPRNLYYSEPAAINYVKTSSSKLNLIEVATGNANKLKEFRRILKGYEVIGKDLDVPEVQSLDPNKVASQKAFLAWEKNHYNPILVEDTSLEMLGLGGRPGTYINDFASEVEMRRQIAEEWLKEKDRRAVARVLIAIYDGKEVHVWEGKVSGKISEELRGINGFGWDDMFIPDNQPKGQNRTFAEMSGEEKDKYSMRTKALESFMKSPLELNYPIYMIPEPYEQELQRVRLHKLQNTKALNFAFSLECLANKTKPNKKLSADKYDPIEYKENKFYSRFIKDQKSSSLGLLLTDIDRSSLKLYKNGNPVLWQMGPERRYLALAQRMEYFMDHQNTQVEKILNKIDAEGMENRVNKRSSTIETALGKNIVGDVTQTKALKEIGYKKISSDKAVSRTRISDFGLYNKIGKYGRSIYGIGSMPPISGWRDILVTSAIGHMPVFTHRNSLNAVDFDNQIKLIKDAKKTLRSLGLSKEAYLRAERNIGAALGSGTIEEETEKARRLYDEANVKLFRIYTINSDPRVIETARALRKEFDDDIEIFVGQIADKKQALALIDPKIRVDALIFGHGGGMQCTSATNGMALTTLEEIYDVITDARFNNVTVVAEGGIGKSVGALLLLGVDLILSNQKLVHGTIETGDLFFEHKSGKPCQPYHGSASAPTMLIESSNDELLEKRMYASGRAKKVEGGPGYMFFSQKANSMAFYVNEFKHYAARTLADLGVEDLSELRRFLDTNNKELFRIISTEASVMSGIHTVT